MKKLLLFCLIILCLATSCFVACVKVKDVTDNPNEGATNNEEVDESIVYDNVIDAVANQVHAEKPGYKFCGYFEDKNLTKRVMTGQETIPTKYYAKYQPDIEQITSYNAVLGRITRPKITFEQTIYAKGSYSDAAVKYKNLNFGDHEFFVAINSLGLHTLLGNNLSPLDVVTAGDGINDFVVFHDDSDKWYLEDMIDNDIVRFDIDRNFTWKAYLGDVEGEVDGFEYYVVNDEYAVICGYSQEAEAFTVEQYTFPAEINGKPVKEISMWLYADTASFSVKTLTVPSSVDNFYLINEYSSGFNYEKIIFEEGVKTIKLKSMQKEDCVIPSTAYYVDLQRLNYGSGPPKDMYLTREREIIVNGGEHYYVDDGFLISKEGDLVHQYAGYEKMDLKVPQGVKRVLRRSVFGLCKNIYVSEGLDYFSPLFNEYSLRYNFSSSLAKINNSSLPILFVDNEKVAKQLINSCIGYNIIDGYRIKSNCRYMFFNESIDWKSIANSCSEKVEGNIANFIQEHDNLPLKLENEVVYRKVYDTEQSSYIDQWETYSYLNKEFKNISVSGLKEDTLTEYSNLKTTTQNA